MSWSFRLFRVGETWVRVHVTLLLFMAWYGWEAWRGGGVAGAIDEVAFLGLLFLSVLLHEFGHIFAARRYAIPTPEILLTPIGGIARIARMPEEPKQELVVALAGPAVTVLIILLLAAWFILTGQGALVFRPGFVDGPLLQAVMWINVALLLFNMIPAFPMDGGRVLRALLASRLGLLKGTEIASRVGQALALGFVFLGIQYNPMLILIAVFVFFGAQTEYAVIRSRALASEWTANSLVVSPVHAVAPEMTIGQLIEQLLTIDQRAFPVLEADGRVLGTVTKEDLLRGVSRQGLDAAVTTIMQPAVGDLLIPAGMPADATLERLARSGREALPVIDAEGRFVGLVTSDHAIDVLVYRRIQSRAGSGRTA